MTFSLIFLFIDGKAYGQPIQNQSESSEKTIPHDPESGTNLTLLSSSRAHPISNISYPSDWNFTSRNPGFKIDSPLEDQNDLYQESLTLEVYPAGVDEVSDSISVDVNNYKRSYTNFTLIDSKETSLLNKPAHRIMYSYFDQNCNCSLKVMSLYTRVGPNLYVLSFYAEPDEFTSYLPRVNKIIESMFIEGKEFNHKLNRAGLPLNGSPVDLAVNPVTNKLYVAIPESRQIQVIDGYTDRLINNITVGAYPNAIAVNPILNRIYVASPETDIIYVIDGNTNKIVRNIQAGPMVGDVNVDTNEFQSYGTLVFVTNQGNNSMSIIDDVKGKVIANIITSMNPFSVGIDSIGNRAYVTTSLGIDVIDYNTNDDHTANAIYSRSIPIDNVPRGIIVNSNTSRAYVTNALGDTVTTIDIGSNDLLYKLQVGLFPNSIAFNPSNKAIYVSNTGESTVTIINSTIEPKINQNPGENTVTIINSTIEPKMFNTTHLDSIPYDVAVNPKTNMIYFANYDSKTVSTINGTTNAKVAALTFHVYPPTTGRIECNDKEIPENNYARLNVGSLCKAKSNYGSLFSSWSLGPPSNSTGTMGNRTNSAILPVSAYGEYTANFISLATVIQIASPYLSIGTLILVTLVAIVKPIFSKRGKLVEESPDPSSTSTADKEKNKVKKDKVKLKKEDSSFLSRAEILTIDATVIIGVLIFLTFTEGFEASEQYQINIITASIVFPFAISAIIGVTKTEILATRLMIAGFINLMISVVLIAIMKL